MSDEDDDYSSDESSFNGDLRQNLNATKSAKSNQKPGILTLEDDENDTNDYHRPDIHFELGDEEDGENEDEVIGEEEDDDDEELRNLKTSNKKKSLVVKQKSSGTLPIRKQDSSVSRAESDDAKKNNSNKKKKKKFIGICVAYTKYECVRRVGKKLGFKEVEENEDWTLFWTDTSVSIDRVNQMKKWQVCYLPG
jgi:tubulin polyglutamylase TTLL6/13